MRKRKAFRVLTGGGVPGSFAVALAALGLFVGQAQAFQTHLFKETFGPAAQPSFEGPASLAVHRPGGEVLVMDFKAETISRFNSDGTPAPFAALGTNTIDGEGAGDATPQGGLSFGSVFSSQVEVDSSGGETDGNVYVTRSSPRAIDVFSDEGEFLGQLSEATGGEVQEVQFEGFANGDTFTLTCDGETTAPITYRSFASLLTNNIRAALEAKCGTGNFLVSGSDSSSVTVAFQGKYGEGDVPQMACTKESGSGTCTVLTVANGHELRPLTNACGAAVDAAGALYVGDREGGIHKYVPSANPPVNADNTANFPSSASAPNPCKLAAGEGPTAGYLFANIGGGIAKLDSADGEFKYKFYPLAERAVAVDPASGHVYGTGRAVGEVAEFDASGPSAPSEALSSFEAGRALQGLAIDNEGNVHLTRENFFQVETYTPLLTVPDVTTGAATEVKHKTARLNGTVNPDGVEVTECYFEYGTTTAYGQIAHCEAPSAAEIGAGTSPVAVHADVSELELGAEYHFRLAAGNESTEELQTAIRGEDETFKLESPPVILASWTVEALLYRATVAALIDPEDFPSTYRFEYVDEASFDASGFAEATSVPVPPGEIPTQVNGRADFQKESAVLKNLTISAGAFAPGQAITATGIPAETTIVGVDLARHTLTLSKPVTSGNGNNRPITATGAQPVSVILRELEPATAYRWRVIADNQIGEEEEAPRVGPLRSFRTHRPPGGTPSCPNDLFRAGAGSSLPDCRAYELVSPVDKGGTDILTQRAFTENSTARDQSATSGEKLTYSSSHSFGDSVSAPYASQYIATRTDEGWLSHGISPPTGRQTGGVAKESEFKAFSADLCSAWLIPVQSPTPPLSAGGLGDASNLYRRSNCGVEGYAVLGWGERGEPEVQGFTGDDEKTLLRTDAHLSQELPRTPGAQLRCQSSSEAEEIAYRWLKDGTPIAGATSDKYTTVPEDESTAIQCQVTAKNTNAGSTQIANPAWIVAPAPPSAPPTAPESIPAPSADGGLGVGGPGGQTLACDPNEAGWGGAPSEFEYRWYRNGEEIPAATEATYQTSAEDLEAPATFQCEAIASNAGGAVAKASEALATAPAPSEPAAPVAVARGAEESNLYLVGGDGTLREVCVLPSGVAARECSAGMRTSIFLAYEQSLNHALAEDGSVAYWTATKSQTGPGPIYARVNPGRPQSAVDEGECTEVAMACTLEVSETVSVPEPEFTTRRATFWGAAPDGSAALFSFDPDRKGGSFGPKRDELYRFDLASRSSTLIATELLGVMGASEDLSRIYFASKEALDGEAVPGEANLYLYQGGKYSFLASLPGSDALSEPADGWTPISIVPLTHSARVSPDGKTAVFISSAPLTGYDNADVMSGEPDTEVFRYLAPSGPEESGQLECVSCNPSGARPGGLLFDPKNVGAFWAASTIAPGQHSLYYPRDLSTDGRRLFFDSFDSLLPADTNGARDVYQWEEAGKGDCKESSPAYSPDNGGCIALISSGRDPLDSEFLDADPTGENVFFRSAESLVAKDPGNIDIYDARIEGGLPQPQAQPACEGDACQSPPAIPAPAQPGSAGFLGAGNPPTPPRSCARSARKAKKAARAARRARKRARKARAPRKARRRARALTGRAKRLRRATKRCRRAKAREARRAGR